MAALTSSFFARARAAMGTERTSRATMRTASRSPRDAIGKPASMTSTPRTASCRAETNLLLGIHGKAGRLLAVAKRCVEDTYDVHVNPLP